MKAVSEEAVPLPHNGDGSNTGVAAEPGSSLGESELFRHRVDEYISKADEVCNLLVIRSVVRSQTSMSRQFSCS